MTHDEALGYLQAMMLGAQKARSDLKESFGDLPEEYLADINKFLFGKGNIVPTLVNAVTKAEQGGPIYGHDLCNFLFIANKLEPAIGICALAPYGVNLPDCEDSWRTEVYR